MSYENLKSIIVKEQVDGIDENSREFDPDRPFAQFDGQWSFRKLRDGFFAFQEAAEKYYDRVHSYYGPDGDAINSDAMWGSNNNADLFEYSKAIAWSVQILRNQYGLQNSGDNVVIYPGPQFELAGNLVRNVFEQVDPNSGIKDRLHKLTNIADAAVQNLREQLGVPGGVYKYGADLPEIALSLRPRALGRRHVR